MEAQNYKQLFKLSLKNGYLAIFAKVVILCCTLFFLVKAVVTVQHQLKDWQQVYQGLLSIDNIFAILLVALLIPVNWGFEALKWQKLASKIESITYLQAYRAILSGLTLGFVTPNRIGDYAGRILELKSEKRTESIGSVLLGRYCQMVITVLTGCLGLLYFLPYLFYSGTLSHILLTSALFILMVAVLLSVYFSGFFVKISSKTRLVKPFEQYFKVISQYKRAELSEILLYSTLRYSVFCIQFMLLLRVFGIDLNWLFLLPGVAATFLLKSLVPTLNFISEIGMRELAAMYFFELMGQKNIQVLSASLSLWLLNLAVPSAVGLYFVLRLKFGKK